MPPPRRRSLGLLFVGLAAAFLAVAVYAATARQWIVVAAAAAIGAWMGDQAFRALR